MLYQIEADFRNGNMVLYLLCGVLGCGCMSKTDLLCENLGLVL